MRSNKQQERFKLHFGNHFFFNQQDEVRTSEGEGADRNKSRKIIKYKKKTLNSRKCNSYPLQAAF